MQKLERQEFLSLKAKKLRAEERNTLSTIGWNDEQEVRLLTAKQLKLKQQCLSVNGGKEMLINRMMRHVTGNRDFTIYDGDVDENVTSKYNFALS